MFLQYNGLNWSYVNDPNLANQVGNYNSVWADNPNFIYACGVKGLLVRYNGTSWNQIQSNTTVDLHSVWGTPGGMTSSTVFASGDNGVIIRIKYASMQAGWQPIANTNTLSTLYGIHGDGTSVVYAVGVAGAVVRADGPSYDTFNAQTDSSTNVLWAVHTLPSGITWLGGLSGFLGYLDARP